MPMARGLRGSVTGRHVIRVFVETLGSTSLQGGRAWESIAPRVTGVGHTSHDRVSGHATRSPEVALLRPHLCRGGPRGHRTNLNLAQTPGR